MRALVGITVGGDDLSPLRYTLRADYVRALERAGGLPVVLPPTRPEDAEALVARLDALLLSGGSDVDPRHYGAARHARLGVVQPERDAFELALTHAALAQDRPLLAICRGHQVLNVARGGTLIQDIPSEVLNGANHDPVAERWEDAHEVSIQRGSRLHAILGRERVAVNSFHHQAVARPGQGLVVSAVASSDQVIEALEDPTRRFVLGVQWHPEGYWRQGEFQALFEALVAAGSRR
jgi:putative glutamine amidotransferase